MNVRLEWARDILARADPEEPPGSPGPGEVELALDIVAGEEEL